MPPLSQENIKRELEYRKCAESFPHFFQNYWKVLYKGSVALPEIREEQVESAKIFQSESRIIVLKARQIGWSTLISAYNFWKAWFKDQQHCLVLSRREDPEARLIIRMIRLGYDNLPNWMQRRGAVILNRNLTKIEFSNGSYIDSDASKEDPARGRTLALLTMDEFGKFPNPESAWASAKPATEHGQLIVIGNPNGYGTEFWRLYTEAKQGMNDLRPLFYPWWVVPGRSKEWYVKETSSMSPAQAAAEYCEDDESCWNKAGSPVFDVDRIKHFSTVVPKSGFVTPLGFRESKDGGLEVWKEPELSFQYVIGADIADGLEHGDYSSAVVICANTGEHVATFEQHLDPHDFGLFLDDLGRYYNRAMIGPERNRNGGAVISHLREVLRYPRIYRERSISGTSSKVRMTDKYGWHTTRESKAVLTSDMWKLLLNGTVVSWDQKLYNQMAAFRYRTDGSMTGSPHDDRLMAFGIAVQLLKATSIKVAPEQRDKESIDWSKPQFAFGKTWEEYEEWESSSRPGTPHSRTTPKVVTISGAKNSAARSAVSVLDTQDNRSLARKPSVVVLSSDVTRTLGRRW
jgi:hypothetical protein